MAENTATKQAVIPFVAVYKGSDSISRERARSETVTEIGTRFPGMTEERFDPMVESFSQFAERMITPSLFSEFRIFFVNHAETLTPAEFGELEHVAQFDVPDVCCIVEADEADGEERGRQGLCRVAQKAGRPCTRAAGSDRHSRLSQAAGL